MKISDVLIKKKEYIFMVLYLAVFVTVATTLVLLQPMSDTPPFFGNPPDEHARYLIPKYICEHGTLPTGFEEEVRISGYGFSYALYNTFPYIIMGYIMRLVSNFTDSELILLYTARFVNVIFGLLMAIMVRKISKRVFKNDSYGWLFTVAVTFLPQCVFIHTYVNTDSLALLSSVCMVYGLLSMYQDNINVKNCAFLVTGIICCALSYYNTYTFILSSIFLFIAYFKNKKSFDWKGMLKWGLPIAALVLLGILWWFIRSYKLFDGDFLGLRTREKMELMYGVRGKDPNFALSGKDRGYSIFSMLFTNGYLKNMYFSFVAEYGSMSILTNMWFYRAFFVFYVTGIAGCFVLMCKSLKKSSFRKIFFQANMLLCAVFPFVLLVYYAYNTDYQFQGRYLLPMLIPFMYYVVRGLEYIASVCKFLPGKLVKAMPIIATVVLSLALIGYVYGTAVPVYQAIGFVLD